MCVKWDREVAREFIVRVKSEIEDPADLWLNEEIWSVDRVPNFCKHFLLL